MPETRQKEDIVPVLKSKELVPESNNGQTTSQMSTAGN